jgi:hypothetical protein
MHGSLLRLGPAGVSRLNDRVALVFSMSAREDQMRLDAAVLLRGVREGWLRASGPPNWPPLGTPANGGSVGRYYVAIDPKNAVVWIDRALSIPLGDNNVLLLDRADEIDALPVVHGKVTISADLGALPPAPASPAEILPAQEWLAKLHKRLQESVPTRDFIAR